MSKVPLLFGSAYKNSPLAIGGNNLKLWLDAADTSTITESSGSVSAWADKSGNSNNATQGTGSEQPVYRATSLNSKPAIGFDSGSTHNLMIPHSAEFNFTSEATFILVSKPTTVGTANQRAIFKNDVWAVGSSSTDNSAGRFTARAIQDYDSTTGYFVLNTPLIWANVFGGTADVFFRKNGALFDTVTGSSNLNTSTGDIYIGNGTTTRPMGHDIAEILIYNRQLTDNELTLIDQYLTAKWGITLA